MALVETGTVCKRTLDRPRRANRMRAIPETRPGCLAVAGAQLGRPDFNWSLKPKPRAGISEPGIVRGERRVRHVVEKPRDAPGSVSAGSRVRGLPGRSRRYRAVARR